MIMIDVAARRMFDGERELLLKPTQCRLVEALSRFHAGVPSEVLYLALGANVDDQANNLKVQIHRLRAALAGAGWPGLIRTIRGTGYRLAQQVGLCGDPIAVFPGRMLGPLRELLWSHPNHAAAEPFIVVLEAVSRAARS